MLKIIEKTLLLAIIRDGNKNPLNVAYFNVCLESLIRIDKEGLCTFRDVKTGHLFNSQGLIFLVSRVMFRGHGWGGESHI